jgi:hypothetical protein
VVSVRHMDWECGKLGKVPRVWIGMMVGLERCPEYGLGCGQYPACGMELWMASKGTLCTGWDCGWFGKVPEVWFG